MQTRLHKVLRKYLIILLVGLCYLIWVLLTGIGIPCPIYSLFGVQCPGCGVTRMIVALFHFDFRAAFGYNQFLFVLSPFILFIIGVGEYNYVKHGKAEIGVLKHTLIPLLVLTLAFGILRNFF